ncbi:hypothetical protein QTP88_028631 [Uroleucon formosanum]
MNISEKFISTIQSLPKVLHVHFAVKNIQKFHNTNENIIKRVNQSRIFCPYENRQEVLLTLVRLRMHLTENHGIESELEEIKFDDETEFQQWKSEMEQKTLTMYVRDRESWTLNDENIKNIYYCHRSNSYIKKGKDIRHIKSTGSNKINEVCPSHIETLQDNKTISVKYWKTHCGHGVEELGRIKLDTESIIQIAVKLKEGVSFDYILDSIRDTASTDSIQRTLLLDQQDLKNITRDFNINYATKKHNNDVISVQLWVKYMQKLETECPIIYYKGQDQDDIYLNKADFALIIMTKFQQRQLKKFGTGKICIDGTHADVISTVPNKLLCTWHIDKNWRQNLNKISGKQEKRDLVYKSLKVLLQLTSVEQFQSCLQKCIKDLSEDSDTIAFCKYFQRIYANQPENWTYFYRLRLGINTNMFLESFHKILKHIYLEGKKIRRLDKSINALMKLTRDGYFKRLTKVSKNASTLF